MKTANISQGRINQEIKNMLKEKLAYLYAMPLENDMYTWHFTIQGPEDTEFHEGLYHGQILLPYEYPFKPPDIVFMNKNGRFQVNKKICLTITQYHPEEWNSAWTVRTMLEAVISLFAESLNGIGSETATPQVRKYLAKQSHNFVCEKCGVLKEILKPRTLKQKLELQKNIEKIELKQYKSECIEKQQEKLERKYTYYEEAKQQLPKKIEIKRVLANEEVKKQEGQQEKQQEEQKEKQKMKQKKKEYQLKKPLSALQRNYRNYELMQHAIIKNNIEYLQVYQSIKWVNNP